MFQSMSHHLSLALMHHTAKVEYISLSLFLILYTRHTHTHANLFLILAVLSDCNSNSLEYNSKLLPGVNQTIEYRDCHVRALA